MKGVVSVIMPVFNGGQFIRCAVDSVLAQTYRDVEIVAVDDGSTDDSAAILSSYGERVRTIRQPNCGNVGEVRNTAIERSTGEFVAFLDQDDWWAPTKLATQVRLMKENESLGLVHTAVRYFREAENCEVAPQNPAARPQDLVGRCFDLLLTGNAICNSSVLVRRTALDRAGGAYDPAIAGNTVQDYGLWLRIAANHEFGFVDHGLTSFRIHAGQGHKNRRAMLGEEIRLINRVWPTAPKLDGRRRRRIGELYDELAVAHLDAGDPWMARACFRKALATLRTPRALWRCLAGFAPTTAIDFMRHRGDIKRKVPATPKV